MEGLVMKVSDCSSWSSSSSYPKVRRKRSKTQPRVQCSPPTLDLDLNGCPYDLPEASNQTCYVCLHSGVGDGNDNGHVGSLDSRERYAAEAVGKHPGLELVAAGPLAAGYIPTGRVLHMNFNAKVKEEPGAPVLTYFAELTITDGNVVIVNCVARIAPSNSLPEIADTGGCLYCRSSNIHHPDYFLDPYRCGREHHLETLRSQVKKLCDFIDKGEEDFYFSPRFSHPGVKYISKRSQLERKMVQVRVYKRRDITEHANVALSLFNGLEGTNFVLVKTGQSGQAFFPEVGNVLHLNFEAVSIDDPNAEVQTFFAEVICTLRYLFADICKCLGPSVLLPGEADLHGCCLCNCTHHPPVLGYLTGREYDEET